MLFVSLWKLCKSLLAFSCSSCILCRTIVSLNHVYLLHFYLKKGKQKKIRHSHPVSWLLFLLLYLFLFRYLLSFQMHRTGFFFLNSLVSLLRYVCFHISHVFCSFFPLHSLFSALLSATDLLQKLLFLLETSHRSEGGHCVSFSHVLPLFPQAPLCFLIFKGCFQPKQDHDFVMLFIQFQA